MAAKKKSARKTHKPKAVRVKYVQRKETNPLGGVNEIVRSGAGALITIGVANAVVKGLKGL
jgi:hypothetical protein